MNRNNGNNRNVNDRISPPYHPNSNNNNSNNHHSNNHHNNIMHHNHNNDTPSPPYCPDGVIKSDSPSRKRRRVSRLPSQSPPDVWEQRRSPRNQTQVFPINMVIIFQ